MDRDWILAVLTDLRTFAASNNLPDLAAQLEDASRVAMAELAATQGTETHGHAAQPLRPVFGTDSGRLGSRRRA